MFETMQPAFSSHAKPVVLADRRRAQTDPAGRLEKCGLELSLKAGHLALENSVTKLLGCPTENTRVRTMASLQCH